MDLSRVVEINWEGGYGSGYLVAPGVVLTARHVLRSNDERLPELGLPCRVRAVGARGAPRPKWDGAELMWFHPTLDIAVMHTDTRDRSHKLPRFARPTHGATKIECQAVGFPKATSTKDVDDTYQLDGVIRSGSLRGSGDLFVDVASAPPQNPESWPGMSGAALFAGDCLVGVVRSYTREFGSGVLKAMPLTALADDPEFCAALGTPCPLLMDVVGDARSGGVDARPPRPVRLKVPNLPKGYQERTQVLVSVRAQVLGKTSASAIVGQTRHAGVHGMGGIGKTVLATAVVRDAAVEAAFPDGICWLSFGRDADPVARQVELGRALTGQAYVFRDWGEGRGELSRITQNERLLIVLDDVWRLDQVDAFGRLGDHCRLLVTTRDRRVLDRLGGKAHQLELLSPQAAVEFLKRAGGASTPELAEIAKECGYLPLALASVGALVASSDYSWPEVLDALRQADIETLRPVLPDYEHQGIFAALAVSVGALSDEEREAFLDCGIFPEDVAIPEAVLARFWAERPGPHASARATANRLVQLTLLQRESVSQEDGGAANGRRYRLHDLYHDYLSQAAKPLQLRHEALLNAYRRACPTGWASFPDDDDYLLDWLPYHLAEAGRRDELRALMFDLDWQRRKIIARGVSSLLTDMRLCRGDTEVERLGRALRMSAHVIINHGARQLEAQLLGRLRREDGKGIATLLVAAWQAVPVNVLIPRGGGHLLPPGPLAATLEGHRGEVKGALQLADDRALSWGSDGTLRLWDLATGESRTLEGHRRWVNGALPLADGRALSWSVDGTLRLWDLATGEGRTLEGHRRWVNGALPLADGRALSWSVDGTLRLWDLATGESHALEGHDGSINGVLLLADGRALSWSVDGTLRLWDLATGESHALEGHDGSVNGVLLLADGRALSWSVDGTLRLWDLATGESRTLEGRHDLILGALVLPDGCALSWLEDHSLRVWDPATEESRVLRGHQDRIRGVLPLADGRALSWSVDGTLRLWDLATGESRTLEGHDGSVKGVLLLADGRALSWGSDGTLRLWDLATGESRTLEGHRRWVNGALPLADGRALSWSIDRTLRLWDLATGEGRTLEGHDGSVKGALPLADGRALSWSVDGTLRLWDLATGESRTLEGHDGSVKGVLLLADGRALSWSVDGTLRLWDLATGEGRTLEGHDGSVNGVLLLADGRALSWSVDGTLRLWDLATGESRTLEGRHDLILGALVLPDGCALSWLEDHSLRVWDPATEESRVLRGHQDRIRGVLPLADGRALSWSVDGTLRLWDLATGESRTLEGHDGSVKGALLLADGRALSWSVDGTLRLWDLATGESHALEGHDRSINGVLLLADGRALSWSIDGTLRLWDLATGESRTLEGHDGSVKGALLLADGRALSWGSDGTLRLWDLATRQEVARGVCDSIIILCRLADNRGDLLVGTPIGQVLIYDLVRPEQQRSI